MEDMGAGGPAQELAGAAQGGEAPARKAAEVEQRFMHIVREMDLSELEIVALRLCIARNDPILHAALEVMRLTGDEQDLKDTLIRLARRTAEAEARKGGVRGAGEADGAAAGGDPEYLRLDEEQRAFLVKSIADEMVNERLVSADQARELLRKLTTGHKIVHAAIDAYETGGDGRLEELSDMLRRIARAS